MGLFKGQNKTHFLVQFDNSYKNYRIRLYFNCCQPNSTFELNILVFFVSLIPTLIMDQISIKTKN